jgi:hypothetical protein
MKVSLETGLLIKSLRQKCPGRFLRERNVLKVFRAVVMPCLILGHYSRRSAGYLEQNNAAVAHAAGL